MQVDLLLVTFIYIADCMQFVLRGVYSDITQLKLLNSTSSNLAGLSRQKMSYTLQCTIKQVSVVSRKLSRISRFDKIRKSFLPRIFAYILYYIRSPHATWYCSYSSFLDASVKHFLVQYSAFRLHFLVCNTAVRWS